MNLDIYRDRLLSYYEVVALVGSITIVAAIATILSPTNWTYVIKSTFIVIAAFAFFISKQIPDISLRVKESYLIKSSLITVILYISYSSIFGRGFLGLLLFLGLLSLQIGLNIAEKPSTKGLAFQSGLLIATFAIYSFTNTGIYVGSVDPLWQHFPSVKSIIENGNTSGVYPRYRSWPLSHIAVAIVGLIADLSPFPASIPFVTSIAFGLSVLSYSLTRTISNQVIAKYALILIPSIYLVSFHIPMLLPKTLAVLFLLLIFVLSDLKNRIAIIPASVALLALIFTHHLSIIIFLGLVPLLYSIGAVQRYRVVVITGMATAAHWLFVDDSFLYSLIFATDKIINNLRGPTPTTVSSIYVFGPELKSETIRTSLIYLGSLQGLYFAAITIVLLSSAYYIIQKKSYYPVIPYAGVCVLFIFPTPLSGLRGVARIGFALSFLLVPALAVGMHNLSTSIDHSSVLTIAVVLAICTLGPAIATGHTPINDVGNEHLPQQSLSLSTTEELSEVAMFQKETDSEMHSFWVTSLYISYDGGSATQNVARGENNITIPEGLFVYRMDWEDYSARIYTPYGGSVILFSEDYLNKELSLRNKVYSSGDARIVWYEEDQTLTT